MAVLVLSVNRKSIILCPLSMGYHLPSQKDSISSLLPMGLHVGVDAVLLLWLLSWLCYQ